MLDFSTQSMMIFLLGRPEFYATSDPQNGGSADCHCERNDLIRDSGQVMGERETRYTHRTWPGSAIGGGTVKLRSNFIK